MSRADEDCRNDRYLQVLNLLALDVSGGSEETSTFHKIKQDVVVALYDAGYRWSRDEDEGCVRAATCLLNGMCAMLEHMENDSGKKEATLADVMRVLGSLKYSEWYGSTGEKEGRENDQRIPPPGAAKGNVVPVEKGEGKRGDATNCRKPMNGKGFQLDPKGNYRLRQNTSSAKLFIHGHDLCRRCPVQLKMKQTPTSHISPFRRMS
ncbi:hypothetical protein BDQ17DRAFT_873298 [Cyathus striatus]|nr:hypothetical protein BDQ17DRAFT_873298 [Cyathus striatus]